MMRTVVCPHCGMQTSAEELAVAEAALAEHVKTHAGDGFSSAQIVTMLDEMKSLRAGIVPSAPVSNAVMTELKECEMLLRTVAAYSQFETGLRQAVIFRANEISKLLS